MNSKDKDLVILPGIILVNVVIFFFAGDYFQVRWSMIPARLTDSLFNLELLSLVRELSTLVTYSFFHADFNHLFSNMLMFAVLGRLVEQELGNLRFAAYYAVSAVAGALALYILGPADVSILLGASGAVSGIMGAYLVLLLTGRSQLTLFSLLGGVVVVYWFYGQLISTWETAVGSRTDSIAYATHLGGFLCGAYMTWCYTKKPRGSARAS